MVKENNNSNGENKMRGFGAIMANNTVHNKMYIGIDNADCTRIAEAFCKMATNRVGTLIEDGDTHYTLTLESGHADAAEIREGKLTVDEFLNYIGL